MSTIDKQSRSPRAASIQPIKSPSPRMTSGVGTARGAGARSQLSTPIPSTDRPTTSVPVARRSILLEASRWGSAQAALGNSRGRSWAQAPEAYGSMPRAAEPGRPKKRNPHGVGRSAWTLHRPRSPSLTLIGAGACPLGRPKGRTLRPPRHRRRRGPLPPIFGSGGRRLPVCAPWTGPGQCGACASSAEL